MFTNGSTAWTARKLRVALRFFSPRYRVFFLAPSTFSAAGKTRGGPGIFAGDLRAFLFCGEIVKHTNSIRAHLFIPLRAFIFFRVQSYLWSEYFGIDSRAEIVLS